MLLFVSSSLTLLSAADFSMRGDYDNNTKSLTPSYSLDWLWDDTYSSGVDVKYSKDVVLTTVEGFSSSNDATEIKLWNFRANAVSYNFFSNGFSASIGGTGSLEYIKKKEFGYFQLPPSMSSTWVTFNNNIDITAYIPSITAGFKYKNSLMNSTFRGDFFPSYLLKVKQDTEFNPIVSTHGTSDQSKWQKAGYSLRFDMAFKTSPYISADLVIRGVSSYLRTDYALDLINYDTTWNFQKGSADVSTLDNSLVAAFAVSSSIFGSATPLFGFGKSWETLSDNKTNKSETTGQWIVTFGVDSKADFGE